MTYLSILVCRPRVCLFLLILPVNYCVWLLFILKLIAVVLPYCLAWFHLANNSASFKAGSIRLIFCWVFFFLIHTKKAALWWKALALGDLGDCEVVSVSHWDGTLNLGFALFIFNLVAEQAESIDNPLHEAAKRGRCDFF